MLKIMKIKRKNREGGEEKGKKSNMDGSV